METLGINFFIWMLLGTALSFPADTTNVQVCHAPVGLAYETIQPMMGFELTSSEGTAGEVRLNGPTAWRVGDVSSEPYVQVTLRRPLLITGIQTQGDPSDSKYVEMFRMEYSLDCGIYSQDSKSYVANLNNNITVTRFFHNVTLAKCIRIIPLEFSGSESALRMELLGCEVERCNSKLPILSSEDIVTGVDVFGKRFKFVSESILTSLVISYEAPEDEDVHFVVTYSRSCADFSLIPDDQVTQVNTREEADPSQQSVQISLLKPVRSQCVQVYTHGQVTFGRVSSFGCSTSAYEGSTEECGRTRTTSGLRRKRVVGGDAVIPGDWPWLVSLHFLRWYNFTNTSGLWHLCGASLVDQQWVLTAAHCVDNTVFNGLNEPENWRVALGEHDQTTPDGTEQFMEIDTIIKHENFTYHNGPILYDIALIKLKEPAILSDYVNIVCLDEANDFPAGSHCTVAGWGQDTMETPGTKLPLKVDLQLIDSAVCSEKYTSLPEDHVARNVVRVDDSVLCVGAEVHGKDACWGDSGGPLLCEKDNQWYQVGLVSLGYTCGDPEFPGIYTRISHYFEWIQSTMLNN